MRKSQHEIKAPVPLTRVV